MGGSSSKENSQTDMSNYYTKSDLEDRFNLYVSGDTANNLYLSKNDAGNLYMRQDAMGSYLTSDNISKIYLSQDNAGNIYIKREDAINMFQPKDDYINKSTFDSILSSYTNTSDLDTKLNDYVKVNVLDGYVLKQDLETKLNNYALSSDLNNYATKDDFLNTVSPSELSLRLNDYITSQKHNEDLSSYAKTTDLDKFITTQKFNEDLSSYARRSELDNYSKSSDLSNYALNSALDNYITSQKYNDDLSTYAKTSALDNYITSQKYNDDLLSYAKASDLDNLVTFKNLDENLSNYAFASDLQNYALNSKLNDYVLNTSLNSTLNNYAKSSDLYNFVQYGDNFNTNVDSRIYTYIENPDTQLAEKLRNFISTDVYRPFAEKTTSDLINIQTNYVKKNSNPSFGSISTNKVNVGDKWSMSKQMVDGQEKLCFGYKETPTTEKLVFCLDKDFNGNVSQSGQPIIIQTDEITKDQCESLPPAQYIAGREGLVLSSECPEGFEKDPGYTKLYENQGIPEPDNYTTYQGCVKKDTDGNIICRTEFTNSPDRGPIGQFVYKPTDRNGVVENYNNSKIQVMKVFGDLEKDYKTLLSDNECDLSPRTINSSADCPTGWTYDEAYGMKYCTLIKEDKQLCSMYSNNQAMNMTSFMNVNNFPNWSYRQSVRQTQQAPAQRLRFRKDPTYLY
jgi:hypothetical protein